MQDYADAADAADAAFSCRFSRYFYVRNKSRNEFWIAASDKLIELLKEC